MLACTRGLDSEEWRGIIWWVTKKKKCGRGRSERGDLEQAVIRSLLKKPTFACYCLAVGRPSSVTSSFRVRFFKEDSVDIALKNMYERAEHRLFHRAFCFLEGDSVFFFHAPTRL